MPTNGRLAKWDALEWGVTSHATTSGYGLHAHHHDAVLETRWADSVLTTALGIRLTVSSGESPGVASWSARYEGPHAPPGGWVTGGAGYRSEISLAARLRGVRLYALGAGSRFRLAAEAIEVWLDGALAITFPAIDLESVGCGPAYLPLCGLPASVTGGNGVAGLTSEGSFDFDLEIVQTVSGGWRFRETAESGWESLPISLPPFDVPAADCAFGLAGPSGIVVASATWGELLRLGAKSRGFRECPSGIALAPAETRGETARGKVWLMPDLQRPLQRLNDHFAVMAERAGLPAVTLLRGRECDDGEFEVGGGGEGETIEQVTVYPRTGARLNVLREETHPWEAPLHRQLWAPCWASRSVTTASNPESVCGDDPAFIPGPGEATFVQFPASVESVEDFPEMLATWHHAHPLLRYWATWFHPYWSTFTFFADWPLEGGPVSRYDYWLPQRTQWLDHSALPSVENTRTRTSLFACALEQSAHTPFLDTFLSGRRWLGVSRFLVDEVVVPPLITTDRAAEDRVSVDDGFVISSDPLIVQAEPGKTEMTVWFRLQGFLDPPYFAPATAREWRWPVLSGATDVVRLVASGDGVMTEEEEPPDTWRLLPSTGGENYVGGWAFDDGGGVADDEGEDTQARGRSSLWLGQTGRSSVSELFGGRQAWRIGLRLTVDDPGGQVTLDWPAFRRCETAPQWIREQAARGAWVWPLGPAFRAGHWDWYLTGWLRPPLVKSQPFVGTALDYLATRCLVWQGVDPEADADAVFSTWFDHFEGNDAAEAEKNSYTFAWKHQASLAMRTAVVNSAAELPPLAHFPIRARDTAGEPVGEWSNELWVGGDEPRWWLSNQPLELRSPDGEEWLVPASPGIPGWKLMGHRHALDHTEAEFDVRSSGETIARVKPWRGVFAVIDGDATAGTALAADVGPDQRAVVAFVRDDTLHLHQFDHDGHRLSVSTINETATTAAVRYDRRTSEARITLWWADAGHLKTATFAEGVWSPPFTIMATEASHPAAWISPDGTTWLYWIVGESEGDVYGQMTDRAGNLLFGPALVSGIGPVEVTGLATGESFESDGRRRISLWACQEGEWREYRSYDGRAFA